MSGRASAIACTVSSRLAARSPKTGVSWHQATTVTASDGSRRWASRTKDDGQGIPSAASATIRRMPMLCLAGAFHVTGTEPDGDSLRFRPADPADWDKVPGATAVRRNASGAAQLRLDAIDALETHYTPQGGHLLHQPLELAHAAAAELLDWLGFTGVTRTGETVKSVAGDGQPGFILTRGADVYGRCVALVGRGDAPGSGMLNVD